MRQEAVLLVDSGVMSDQGKSRNENRGKASYLIRNEIRKKGKSQPVYRIVSAQIPDFELCRLISNEE